ncbi:MAG: hypothetical protein FWF58_02755, partial [Firmicutes bacterium]|nr:hypothetical protein [Bacillota bacterium]
QKAISKLQSNTNMDASKPYPLVMDAAFSSTDATHIKNITQVIPSIAEQVILIIMEKDWQYAKSVLAEKCGKSYIIDKLSETSSTIKEVNNV